MTAQQNDGWNVVSVTNTPAAATPPPAGWNVVSVSDTPKQASPAPNDGWNVVNVSDMPKQPAATAAPVQSAPPQQGFFGSAADASGLSMLGHAILHPLDTMSNVANALGPAASVRQDNPIVQGVNSMVDNTTSNIKQGIADYKQSGLSQQTRRDFGRAVPFVGPVLAQAQSQYDAGNRAGMAGTLAGTVLGGVLPDAYTGALKIPYAAKAAVRGDVEAPIAGGMMSPAERYAAAKRLGVNLDLADATNSPILRGFKSFNSESLAGSPSYDSLKAGNISALQNAADNELQNTYSGDREAGGSAIQDALKQNHAGLRSGAESGFDALTKQTSGVPVKGAPAVGQMAKSILGEIQPLAQQYPTLAPKNTLGVLNDLTKVGAAPKPVVPSFLDREAGYTPVQPQPAPTTWSDLQRLRSATHDLTTSNPDLVKSHAIAPLQQMTNSIDSAMTNAASGLNPAQEALFRASNNDWKEMKATYDDPSSPLYHAVRTNSPSTLYGGIGTKTPEAARDLATRLSPLGQDDPLQPGQMGPSYGSQPQSPALGALRRGTVEGALKTTNDGSPNFRTFGTQWNRIPEDYRASLFTPRQNQSWNDVATTANTLSNDLNPSGSAKQGQKMIEGMSSASTLGGVVPATLYGHPDVAAFSVAGNLAYHAGHHYAGKLMTNPSVVDWMMRPAQTPNWSMPPGTGLATNRNAYAPPATSLAIKNPTR